MADEKKEKKGAKQESAKAEKAEAPKKAKKGKSKRRSIPIANICVRASYNNTIVTIAEPNGDTVAWASSGSSGFKGARKATPYAAQVAAEKAVEKAKVFGLEKAHIFVNGVGNGREQAVRGLVAAGIDIISITDTTAIPHNGCRHRKGRRV